MFNSSSNQATISNQPRPTTPPPPYTPIAPHEADAPPLPYFPPINWQYIFNLLFAHCSEKIKNHPLNLSQQDIKNYYSDITKDICLLIHHAVPADVVWNAAKARLAILLTVITVTFMEENIEGCLEDIWQKVYTNFFAGSVLSTSDSYKNALLPPGSQEQINYTNLIRLFNEIKAKNDPDIQPYALLDFCNEKSLIPKLFKEKYSTVILTALTNSLGDFSLSMLINYQTIEQFLSPTITIQPGANAETTIYLMREDLAEIHKIICRCKYCGYALLAIPGIVFAKYFFACEMVELPWSLMISNGVACFSALSLKLIPWSRCPTSFKRNVYKKIQHYKKVRCCTCQSAARDGYLAIQ